MRNGQARTLPAKPEKLSSIPGPHVVEGENQFVQVILLPQKVHQGTYAPLLVYTHNTQQQNHFPSICARIWLGGSKC